MRVIDPVIANQPSSTLITETKAAIANVSALKRAAGRDTAGLSKALKAASNYASNVDKTLREARGDARRAHAQFRKAFASAEKIEGIGDESPLRLKDGRLKPLSSSSALKNMLGIGAGERNRQAVAMFDKSGGATTRYELRNALIEARDMDVAATRKHLDAVTPRLLKIMTEVQALTRLPSERATSADAIKNETFTELMRIKEEHELTTYRQAAHSMEATELWASLAGTQDVLRAQQFMSTAMDQADTQGYPVMGSAGRQMVRFVINGFSSMPVNSRYAFKGEGPARAYTRMTSFHVGSVSNEGDFYRVELNEVPVSNRMLDNAHTLGL